MLLDARDMEYTALNKAIRNTDSEIEIINCLGQRFIGAGLQNKTITIHGIPGNALGAYLNSARITVHSNAQDAVSDTMNAGKIVIHGSIGDAAGYGHRGVQAASLGNISQVVSYSFWD